DLPEPVPAGAARDGPGLRGNQPRASRAGAAAARLRIGALVRRSRVLRRRGGPQLAGDPGRIRADEHGAVLDCRDPDHSGLHLVVDDATAARVSPAYHVPEFRDPLAFERGLSPRTLEPYGRDIARLAAFLAARGIRRPGEAGAADLRAFVYHLKDQGLQPTSIRRNLSAVRTYFAFLLAEGLVLTDPSERLEAPRTWRRLPSVLSRADVERLLEAPDPFDRLYWRDRAILEVAYASGVRVSELTALRLKDLALDDGFATVLGKGAKERIVPLGRSAVRTL